MQSQIDPTLAPNSLGKVEISNMRTQLAVAKSEISERVVGKFNATTGALEGFKNLDDTDASIGGFQQLPHLVGIPASNIGAATADKVVNKSYTFSSASIASNELTLASAGTPGNTPTNTARLTAGGFPLDPSSDGLGAMIYDNGGLIPHGTYISSYGTGTNVAAAGTYNLTNFFGAAIPNIASGATIYAAACYNATTNYLLTNDCNLHQCTFTNARIIQGSSTSGSHADTPVTNDLRLYAYYEFSGNDGVNTRVTVPATFDGQPYLVMPGNVLVKKKCDPVFYPAYEGQIVDIKYFIINNDLKGSAFTVPGYNFTTNATTTGKQEGILNGGSNFGKQLTTNTNNWNGGSTRILSNQYRPFGFIAGVVESLGVPEVFIAGDSITSAEYNYLVTLLKNANIPYVNVAKGGEDQRNWPMNVQARMAAAAGNIFVCGLATNGGVRGASAAADILSVVKQARALGFKRVVAITSTVQTSASVQISASSIAGTTLTVAGFTTGTELPIGAVVWDGTLVKAKVASKTDATHYEVTNVDGSAYTGGSLSGLTVYAWGSDETQTANTNHVQMNNVILSWPKGGDYPDETLDVWAATRSATSRDKWASFLSTDGVHITNTDSTGIGYTGTSKVVEYANANNWVGLITG